MGCQLPHTPWVTRASGRNCTGRPHGGTIRSKVSRVSRWWPGASLACAGPPPGSLPTIHRLLQGAPRLFAGLLVFVRRVRFCGAMLHGALQRNCANDEWKRESPEAWVWFRMNSPRRWMNDGPTVITAAGSRPVGQVPPRLGRICTKRIGNTLTRVPHTMRVFPNNETEVWGHA